MNLDKKLAKIEFGLEATTLNTRNPYLWASGFFMPIYNDNRLLLSSAEYRQMIAKGFADIIRKEKIRVDMIAGTSTAGIPHATTLADLLGKPLIYIRDKPKDHGKKNQIEGPDPEGKSVIVIEDLISTGGSSVKAVDAVRNAKGRVNYLFSIFNYGLEDASRMFAGDIPFGSDGATLNPPCNVRSLLTYDKLLEVALDTKYIDKRQAEALREWRADPFDWGRKHGWHWLRGHDTAKLSRKEKLASARICLAADVPTTRDALALADGFSDLVGMIKIGKGTNQAAVNEGYPLLRKLYQTGIQTFLDLKLHDTPDQVYGTAKQCTVPGVAMFNIHVAGGEEMCKQAVKGATEAAIARGIERPKVIGVTVLTSLDDEDLRDLSVNRKYDDYLMHMTRNAKKWGLDGIVCPASKAGELEKKFGKWCYVTPGIKYAGVQNVGQKQLDTPDGAVQACDSSVLVIGSAITKAKDRRGTAYEIVKTMAKHI